MCYFLKHYLMYQSLLGTWSPFNASQVICHSLCRNSMQQRHELYTDVVIRRSCGSTNVSHYSGVCPVWNFYIIKCESLSKFCQSADVFNLTYAIQLAYAFHRVSIFFFVHRSGLTPVWELFPFTIQHPTFPLKPVAASVKIAGTPRP